MPIWLADGHRVELRLAAVYERSRGFGDLVLPARLVAEHAPVGLVRSVAVRHHGDLPARIQAHWPDLRVATAAAATVPSDAGNQQGAWELLVGVSLGFTAIAVVNTFAVATAARRREYADLRLAGATAAQVYRLALSEAAITVVVGLLIGAAITAVVVGAFSVAQDGTFRLIVNLPTYAAMVGAVGGLGVLAGALPVRWVVRRQSPPLAVGEP